MSEHSPAEEVAAFARAYWALWFWPLAMGALVWGNVPHFARHATTFRR